MGLSIARRRASVMRGGGTGAAGGCSAPWAWMSGFLRSFPCERCGRWGCAGASPQGGIGRWSCRAGAGRPAGRPRGFDGTSPMPIWSMVPTAAWRAIESARSWSRSLPGMSRCDALRARRRGKPKRPGQQWPRRGMCAYSAASRCQRFNESLVSMATPTIVSWHSNVHGRNRLTSALHSIMEDVGMEDRRCRESRAPGAASRRAGGEDRVGKLCTAPRNRLHIIDVGRSGRGVARHIQDEAWCTDQRLGSHGG